MWRPGVWLGALVLIGGTLACDLKPGIPVTPTLIATQPHPSPSVTLTIALSFTPSNTPSVTVTPSRTPSLTVTMTNTQTPTVTRSATGRIALLITTVAATVSPTRTPSPTLTDTLTFTLSALPPTFTPTLVPTEIPSLTPSWTAAPSLTAASSLTPTEVLTATHTVTLSLIPATRAPPSPTFSLIPATPIPPTLTAIPAVSTAVVTLTLTPSLSPIPLSQQTRVVIPTHVPVFLPPAPPNLSTTTPIPASGGPGNNGNGSGNGGPTNGSGNNGNTSGTGNGAPVIGPYATVTALAETPIPTFDFYYSIYGNGSPSIYRLNGGFVTTLQPGQQYAINPQTGAVAAINSDGVLSINNLAFTFSPYSQFGPPPHLRILKMSWSPDGRFLFFQTATDDAANGKLDFQQTINDGLWVFDPAARSTRQIFRNQYICCANLPIQIVADAAWAADSKNILIWFTSDPARLTPFLVDSTQTINLNPAPSH